MPLTQFLCAKCFAEVTAGIRAGGFEAGLEAAAEWVEENVAVACDSVDTAAAIRDLTEEAKP